MRVLGTEDEKSPGQVSGCCNSQLGALYEFIETYVKYSPDNELDWP